MRASVIIMEDRCTYTLVRGPHKGERCGFRPGHLSPHRSPFSVAGLLARDNRWATDTEHRERNKLKARQRGRRKAIQRDRERIAELEAILGGA